MQSHSSTVGWNYANCTWLVENFELCPFRRSQFGSFPLFLHAVCPHPPKAKGSLCFEKWHRAVFFCHWEAKTPFLGFVLDLGSRIVLDQILVICCQPIMQIRNGHFWNECLLTKYPCYWWHLHFAYTGLFVALKKVPFIFNHAFLHNFMKTIRHCYHCMFQSWKKHWKLLNAVTTLPLLACFILFIVLQKTITNSTA